MSPTLVKVTARAPRYLLTMLVALMAFDAVVAGLVAFALFQSAQRVNTFAEGELTCQSYYTNEIGSTSYLVARCTRGAP